MIDNLCHVFIHYYDWQSLSCFHSLLWLTIFIMFLFNIIIDNLCHVFVQYYDWQSFMFSFIIMIDNLSCFCSLLWLTIFVMFSFIIMIDNLYHVFVHYSDWQSWYIFLYILIYVSNLFFIRNLVFRILMSQRENPRWCISHPSSNPSLVNPCSSILRSTTSRCRPWSPRLEDKKTARRPGSEAGSLVGEINNCFVIIKFD